MSDRESDGKGGSEKGSRAGGGWGDSDDESLVSLDDPPRADSGGEGDDGAVPAGASALIASAGEGFGPRRLGKKKVLRRGPPKKPGAADGGVGSKRKRGAGASGDKAAKKPRKPVSEREALRRRYIDEVEEDDDLDEEEDEGEAPADRGEVYRRLREEADERARLRAAQKSAEEVAAELERRAAATQYASREEHIDVRDRVHTDAYQGANMPTATDPKLWMLKCKDGAETEVLIALANKFHAMELAGTPLAILSATSTHKG